MVTVKAPLQPAERSIDYSSISQPKPVNPFFIQPDTELNIAYSGAEELLSWDEFQKISGYSGVRPTGFRSALQRSLKIDTHTDFIRILEFDKSIEAINYVWGLNLQQRGSLGVISENYFVTIADRFVHSSPLTLYSSQAQSIKLHGMLSKNLNSSLMILDAFKKAQNVKIIEWSWNAQNLGEILQMNIENEAVYLIPEKTLVQFDSREYSRRPYSVGDLSLLKVKSSINGNLFYGLQLQDYLLVHTGLTRNLSLKDKFLLRKLFK